MSLSPYSDLINNLWKEYPSGAMHNNFSFYEDGFIDMTGFTGSNNGIFLDGKIVTLEAPACIAAPLVTIVGRGAIDLGVKGKGSQPVPARLCAPQQLCISTNELSVRDIVLIVDPKHSSIFCKKLILTKSTEEDPPHFEMIKSWVVNDSAEVEVEVKIE